MTLASFATLLNQKVIVPSPRTQYVSVQREHLIDFLKPILRKIFFDRDWYLKFYPDLVEAIERGVVTDPLDHYVTYGYYEHRLPYKIEVDESWYLKEYKDVNEAVSKGEYLSATEHYYAVGFKEGRLPHANFSLRLVE